MAVVGYARVSTRDQVAGLEAQLAELTAAGCSKLFREVGSGVDAARPQLAEALRFLREGDTFVVTRPDRLARSIADLLGTVKDLQARGVDLRVLSMGLDTTNATGKLILTVLAGVAEFERELMLERQRAGIARAKAEGKYRGRKPTAQAHAEEVRRRVTAGEAPAAVAKALGIGRASVYRILGAPAA